MNRTYHPVFFYTVPIDGAPGCLVGKVRKDVHNGARNTTSNVPSV